MGRGAPTPRIGNCRPARRTIGAVNDSGLSNDSYDRWKALAAKDLRGADPDTLIVAHPRGHRRQAALHRGRPRRRSTIVDTLPGFAPVHPRARGPRCTPTGRGPSASTPASPPPRSPTPSTAATWPPARRACRWPSTWPPTAATTRDHPRVVGDVGKAGVAIDSVEDMKILFDGIPLDKMSVSMTMNGAVLPVLAVLRRGRRGAGRRARTSSPGPSRTTSSKSSWSATPTSTRPSRACGSWPTSSSTRPRNMPKFNSISISGYHMQEAGATAEQELAFTIADGLEYVRAALDRGLDVDEFAGRLSFFFAIGMDFFMEIAKLRAARLLWHRVDGRVRPEEAQLARCCAPTARPPACRSPSRTRTTTSCAPPSRPWPRCSAARRACTPTPSTRRSACPPTSRPASPATPS